MTDRKWRHDELLGDLALHLAQQGRMVFCDRLIGAAGSQRPDILSINKSYTRWNPRVYEIKVRRADFLNDINSGKWQGYLGVGAVVFAVPHGLIKRTELPDRAGLIVRSDSGWRYQRKPAAVVLDSFEFKTWMALLMHLHTAAGQARIEPRREIFTKAAEGRSEWGEEIGKFVRDRHAAMGQIERDRAEAKRILEDAHARRDCIVQAAQDENPRVIEAVRTVLQERGINVSGHRWGPLEKQLREMLDAHEKRYSVDASLSQIHRDLEHLVAATKPRGVDST